MYLFNALYILMLHVQININTNYCINVYNYIVDTAIYNLTSMLY